MIAHLEQAATISSDPPDAPTIETTHIIHTGQRGRPRIEINRDILATALEMRGPALLADVFGTSARTVRRRAIEYGLAEPGPPVFLQYQTEDGSTHCYHTSTTAAMSDLSDEALDAIPRQIIETFPNFGRRMIDGHLKSLGYRVPRSRVQESYLQVHGAPAASFGARRIERRVYSVPGPNSLWHHDGQHGMFIEVT